MRHIEASILKIKVTPVSINNEVRSRVNQMEKSKLSMTDEEKIE